MLSHDFLRHSVVFFVIILSEILLTAVTNA